MDLENEKDGALPKDHPRYQSLTFRHQIIEGMKQKVVAEAGLIAHGRGECFDYIIGEKTTKTAEIFKIFLKFLLTFLNLFYNLIKRLKPSAMLMVPALLRG